MRFTYREPKTACACHLDCPVCAHPNTYHSPAEVKLHNLRSACHGERVYRNATTITTTTLAALESTFNTVVNWTYPVPDSGTYSLSQRPGHPLSQWLGHPPVPDSGT